MFSGTEPPQKSRKNRQRQIRKAVFPVAGLGTRFLPATKAMPKEMLTVVDKPLIQYAVEEAVAAGITELIFVTGRGKDALENHFDQPYELLDTLRKKGKMAELNRVQNILPPKVRIAYTRQGEPLGLGHAVLCARPFVGEEPFAVLLPDDIIHARAGGLADMVAAFEDSGVSNVLCQEVPQDRTKNYGILDTGGAAVPASGGRVPVQAFVEKPAPEAAPSRLAVMGRYVLHPAIFDHLERREVGAGGEIQLTDAMDKLARAGAAAAETGAAACLGAGFEGVVLDGERFDCGDKVGFQQANLYFALQDPYIAPRLKAYLQEKAALWQG